MLEILAGILLVSLMFNLFDPHGGRQKPAPPTGKPDGMKLTVQIGGHTYELKELKKKKS